MTSPRAGLTQPLLFAIVVLAGGVPLAYYTFAKPTLVDAHVGPFGLMPLMVWPGLLALLFPGRAGLGWRPPTLWGVAAGLAYPVLVVAATVGIAWLAGLGKPMPNVVGETLRAWGRELSVAFAVALLPVLGEELGWRGFLQQRLEPLGRTRALLIASAVATAFHAGTLFGAPMRAAGVAGVASFLGAVFLLQLGAGAIFRLGGGSVFASFLFHLVWNATNPVFTSNVYGGEPGFLTGLAWQTSGEGLAGIAASAVCLPALLWLARTRPWLRITRPTAGAWIALALVSVGLVAGSALTTPTSSLTPTPEESLRAEVTTEPSPAPEPAAAPEPAPAPAPKGPLRPRVQRAITAGLKFLESMLNEVSLDAVFLLRLVEGAMPDSGAGPMAARALPAAKRDPTYPLFKKIVEKARIPHPARALPSLPALGTPNPEQAFDEKFSDQCLTAALECRWAPGCKPYKEKLGQWGYVLSHQILFFLFVKEGGCGQRMGVDADAFLGAMGRAMLHEQRTHPAWSDLMAERVGLGAYAGFASFLEDEWIENMIDAQRPEGCWWWRPEDPGCSDHASGMAVWALALWLRANPVQDGR